MSLNTAVLHYIYDPLCGWCYGAAPLVAAARTVLPVVGHAGGMMTGANCKQGGPGWRNYVMPHDHRIADLTGQEFGAAYFNGLLLDEEAIFDSAPPTAAILAAEEMAGSGLDMLARLQQAHYAEGRRIADVAVLHALAVELGLDEGVFAAAYGRINDDELQQHITVSRRLLSQVGGHGFPTFALERDGRMEVLDTGLWLGRPDAWREHLAQMRPR
ncbi:DsbA family protein [Herbaspirillum sp. RTI4]|uniref:DsbA family protein n=1 Tax=Herbaspirillum sp. RTI4 TaxID=3048640 RepID=UPI002AB5C5FA|nr:DsbA family protein [Herbaspirillum sp. RTI4]MDY7577284.1 DsbA family protein [Herbaspirillum sp. RTI4]MEA9982950.1 DsbA family protein [Herbaspirillum sp. RTI4]